MMEIIYYFQLKVLVQIVMVLANVVFDKPSTIFKPVGLAFKSANGTIEPDEIYYVGVHGTGLVYFSHW